MGRHDSVFIPGTTIRHDSIRILSAPGSETETAPTSETVPNPVPVVESTVNTPPPARRTVEPIELPDDIPGPPAIDLTRAPDNLLDRIRNGFSMPNLDSPLVADRQAWYLNNPGQLRVMLERSRRYLHHIVSELEHRGMPMELALLPMVESAFNPHALSSAQAAGLWQFIPSTGRSYNLAQNSWLDQRRDIVASTQAALDYLQVIYEMNGDWHLALASYNWGENAVARAIQKNQAAGLPTDYMSLNMPAETRYYVPKLQALKNIIAQPALFGVALPAIPNRPYFASVEARGSMHIATAARLANMSVDEFVALNPAYNRPIMVHGQGASILIPAQNVDTYLANLDTHNTTPNKWATYTATRSDKLELIAARFGISAGALRQINGLSSRARVSAGQFLLVPTSPEFLPSTVTRNSAPSGKGVAKARGKARPASKPVKPNRAVKARGKTRG